MAKEWLTSKKPPGGVNWGCSGFARGKGSTHYSRYFNPDKSPNSYKSQKKVKRGILVWNNGTYIRAIHGELKI